MNFSIIATMIEGSRRVKAGCARHFCLNATPLPINDSLSLNYHINGRTCSPGDNKSEKEVEEGTRRLIKDPTVLFADRSTQFRGFGPVARLVNVSRYQGSGLSRVFVCFKCIFSESQQSWTFRTFESST